MISRLGVGVVVGLVVLSACGSPSSDADPVRETPADPPRSWTDGELAAALPTVDDVPEADELEAGCPSVGEGCLDADGVESHTSVSFTLQPPAAEQSQAEADLAGHSVAEGLDLSAYRFEDVAAAEAFVAETADDTEFEESFSTEAVDLGEGRYEPGLTGTGVLEPVEVGDFTGAVKARALALVDRDGDAGLPFLDVFTSVGLGTTVVTCVAVAWPEYRGDDGARDLCEETIAGYVERLP